MEDSKLCPSNLAEESERESTAYSLLFEHIERMENPMELQSQMIMSAGWNGTSSLHWLLHSSTVVILQAPSLASLYLRHKSFAYDCQCDP